MIKSRIRFVAIIAMMLILVLFTITRVNTVTYLNESNGISPKPSTYKFESKIYYMNNNSMLESESRTLTIYNNDLVGSVIREITALPKTMSLRPVITSDVKILDAEIINQKLYINFSRDILDSTLWQINYYDVIFYAIVNSLTELDTIERVQIKIEGRDINAYIKSDKIYAEFTYNDTLNFNKPASSREVVETFLNYIMLERYDLAYNMTNLNGKLDMAKSDFETVMKSYRQNKLSYVITNSFVNDEDGYWIVVNYEYYDSVRNVQYDGGSEEWELTKDELGNYHIVWPRPSK